MKVRRTTWLIVGLSTFLVGLVWARQGILLDTSWVWLCLIAATLTYKKLNLLSVISIALFAFTLGWLRGGNYLQTLQPYQQLAKQKVLLVGQADTDATYSERSQLLIDITDIHVVEPELIKLPGKIKIEGFGAGIVYRGDIVQVEGKLFPTRGSRQATITFADIKVKGRSNSFIEKIRHEFVAGMQTVLPEPQASFGLGLLVGQRSDLPEATLAGLSMVGLTHIVAVSGYNLTILVRAARRIFAKSSKYQTLLFSLVLIMGFLAITGLSPSIVRASIVSGLSLVAWYYGRTFRPLLLILLTAALTAGWYPTYLWSDIGWYLSFLAFYGVLVLAPLIAKRMNIQTTKLLPGLILESFCAQIMTVPLIMFIFHEVSIISLVANMLVVPLVPFAMLFSFIAGLAGMLAPVAGSWLALPAQILLTSMLDIVALLSRIPHVLREHALTVFQLGMSYALLASISFVLWQKTKTKNGTITDEIIEEV
jgi:competence protein ComEC